MFHRPLFQCPPRWSFLPSRLLQDDVNHKKSQHSSCHSLEPGHQALTYKSVALRFPCLKICGCTSRWPQAMPAPSLHLLSRPSLLCALSSKDSSRQRVLSLGLFQAGSALSFPVRFRTLRQALHPAPCLVGQGILLLGSLLWGKLFPAHPCLPNHPGDAAAGSHQNEYQVQLIHCYPPFPRQPRRTRV